MSKRSETSDVGPAEKSLPAEPRSSTGIAGLDQILGGGLPAGRLHAIHGDPGVGKTTLGLQFALAGVRAGERALYLTMSESENEIRAIARSHNWSLEGVEVHHHSSNQPFDVAAHQTMLHPAEVELPETTETLFKLVNQARPDRVIVDSLSELRLLSRDGRWYRRQICALKDFFVDRKCTTIFLDDRPHRELDFDVESIVGGVIQMERDTPAFGRARRRMLVVKMRGVRFDDGYHDMALHTGGIEVYPRLVAAEHRQNYVPEPISSGIAELDKLLGGGADRGTSILVSGPAGVGKSSLAMQFVVAAIERGEQCLVYAFDERLQTLVKRCQGWGFDLEAARQNGSVDLRQVDPAELTPGEFSHQIRESIEKNKTRIVIIDSINGYLHAMPDEKFLDLHLHELVAYLAEQRVTTLLIHAEHGLIGPHVSSPIDVSYIADTVLLLRYFEFGGEVRQALSVHKRRGGPHERVIREMRITSRGIALGEPLRQFSGVLTGAPVFTGERLGGTGA